MIFSRAWWALMRRNMIYRKRNWLGTILEIGLPIAFVGILVAIKNSVQGTSSFAPKVIDPVFPPNELAYTPLSFGDYVTAIQAKRYCVGSDSEFNITGIYNMGENWQVPFVKCDSRQCQINGESALPYCEFGAIGVAPSSTADTGGLRRSKDFATWIYETYPALYNRSGELPFAFEIVQNFSSPDAIDEYVQSEDYGSDEMHPKLVMAIVWEGSADNAWTYTLRQNSTNFNAPEKESRPTAQTTPPTSTLFASYAKTDFEVCNADQGGPDQGILSGSCTGQYLYNGVLTFTRLVGDYILDRSGAKSRGYYVSEGGVQYVQFPTKKYTQNGFYATIKVYGPLLVTLGLLYPVAAMISYVVREKELRQKELMKMMSVTESDIGQSWFVNFFIYGLITASATAGLSTALYDKSSPTYLWLFWFFTFLAVVVFTMFISTLTSVATRAVLVGLLIFFIGVFLTLAVSYETGSAAVIAVISLHPVAAFSYGLQEIGRLEDLGVGLQPSSVGFSDSPSGYTFNQSLISLIFDSVLWGVVTFYLIRVIKPAYGQALPWYFPFTLSFWCPGRSKAPVESASDKDNTPQDIPFEPVSANLLRQRDEGKSIEIHNLRKTFGEKTAIESLNLSMYNGQITALLGHNGAGKTTTISCLTGALAPTEGYATIAGKDIRTQLQQIRQDIGICLQHDCLFPALTVREHIQFFSRIKGSYATMSRKEAEAKVDAALQDVALSEKSNTLSKNLSGGMKRKLSVAIAFCGGSQIVILDEPTSGMDPFSRRFTWNVIRNYRQDRCIILTTHFMDEADILGDRIAIMSEGRLRCAGSSLFLKKTYGVGYHLTIEKSNASENLIRDDASKEDLEKEVPNGRSTDERLKQIVTSSVAEASLLSNVASEISFQLPMGAASRFPPMFEQLDSEIDRDAISSYGVSITTLDEVFLLVARGETKERDEFASASMKSGGLAAALADPDKSVRSRMDLEKEGLFLTHLAALFRKRAANFKRDRKAWVCTTILPSLFVLIGFLIFKFASPTRDLQPLTLNLNQYNPNVKTSPRNPIAFNTPEDSPFTCQPGTCAYYQQPVTILPTFEEVYFFCGYSGRLRTLANCSISQSLSIAERIVDDGAVAEPTIAENVLQASLSLFQTSDMYTASQYGAIFFSHELNSTIGSGELYSDAVVRSCESFPGNYSGPCTRLPGMGYVIQYNYTALHVSPLYQTLADEALAREALSTDDFTIQLTINPLPITKVEAGLGKAQDAVTAWFLVVLSFPFIAGAFATFVVTERQSKAKHLQTVAGVQPSAYWISTYLWDILNYQIPLWITVILMFAFGIDVLTTSSQGVVSGVIVTLFLYGPASAAFTYCLSFAFQSAALCNIVVIITGFLVAMGGPLAAFILILIGNDPAKPQQNLIDAANILTWILRFIPAFNMGKGLFNAIYIDTFTYLEGTEVSAWSEPVLLYEVIFLAWESIVYLILAIQLDKWSSNPRAVSIWRNFIGCITLRWVFGSKEKADRQSFLALADEDDDVMKEQERVLSGGANNDLIVLSQLTKQYDDGKLAVNNLSFGIPPGECFGLLGINGAGKTSTMAMLTAEFPPTSGDATLAGFSVRNEPEKTRRRIGYCPQFDAHFANMSGREHVELYAAIKGVPKNLIKQAAAEKLREVGLSDFDADRLSSGYSGGMKRRLSLACAMIGQPQIVFLDECSTGVDPVARREIWQLISNMVVGGNVPLEERTSVILTTHSMEECEALCPRIAIMANGRLRCLGSAQHLKNKFGQGFQVELKVKLVSHEDSDYILNAQALARSKLGTTGDEENPTATENLFFNLEEVTKALNELSGDDFLTSMVAHDNPWGGYSVWRDANSAVGASLEHVAAFATTELRMRKLDLFVMEHYPNSLLRERQDNKARYEVPSEGVRIALIFAIIEANKDDLQLADYGVSQTSLEQVFNMHAAEAEKKKKPRDSDDEFVEIEL